MKIEIELNDLEKLKTELSTLKKKNNEYKEKIESLDTEKLRKDALLLANNVFVKVMNRVFEEMGYKGVTNVFFDVDFMRLDHFLGINWWGCEDLKIEYGKKITNHIKTAFIALDIKKENIK